MLMAILAILGIAVCVYGIATGGISLGIVFVISLCIFLYCLFMLSFDKLNKMADLGIGVMIAALLMLAYSVCYLFFDFDIEAVLGL